MANKKGTLDMGIVEGKLLEKIVVFQTKLMILAREEGLSIVEMSVALDLMKNFLEKEGIHSGVILDKRK